MHLGQVLPGSSCRVIEIGDQHAEILSRLYALGVFPGVTLKILRFAPLGDPMQVKVGHTLVSIRRAEADVILVDNVSAEVA